VIIESVGEGCLRILAPAKINLFLEVLGERPDGYHNIETLVQEVNLFDEITLKVAEGLSLTVEGYSLPEGRGNLMMRAARLLQRDSGTSLGARMSLVKRIPVGAGLGGGSSDAAAALAGLNILWGLNYPRGALLSLASRIGSDVCFFFYGHTAICRGRGEIVEPVQEKRRFLYLLVCPEIEISTGMVYRELKKDLTEKRLSANFYMETYMGSGSAEVGRHYFNRLERTAQRLFPELRALKGRLARTGCQGIGLSGSGGTYFLSFINDKRRKEAREVLKAEGIERVFEVENI